MQDHKSDSKLKQYEEILDYPITDHKILKVHSLHEDKQLTEFSSDEVVRLHCVKANEFLTPVKVRGNVIMGDAGQ